MVRFVALPKSIEDQGMKKLLNDFDKGVMAEILQPGKFSVVKVIVCQDGRSRIDESYTQGFKSQLERLYEYYGFRYTQLSRLLQI